VVTREIPGGPATRLSLVLVRASRMDMWVRCASVPGWKAIEEAEPDFAGRVRRLFDAGRHKTIATLRADGSPRISGIECEFTDGELRFGSMTGARKGADLTRDPRFALHGPTFHPAEGNERDWPGEAKIAGRAIRAGAVTTDEAGEQPDGEMFVADITEVVITGLNAEATKLVVESWTPERGLQRVERD
jgi:Pyridoxamine 5'-phosphate oxidase